MSEFTKGEWTVDEPLDMEGMHHIFLRIDGKLAGRIDGHLNGISCGKKGYPNREETIEIADLIASAPDLKQQRDDLLEALKKYGQHIDGCDICLTYYQNEITGRPSICTCGFEDALAKAKE